MRVPLAILCSEKEPVAEKKKPASEVKNSKEGGEEGERIARGRERRCDREGGRKGRIRVKLTNSEQNSVCEGERWLFLGGGRGGERKERGEGGSDAGEEGGRMASSRGGPIVKFTCLLK